MSMKSPGTEDAHNCFCIKCGRLRGYDQRGVCDSCGSTIAAGPRPIRKTDRPAVLAKGAGGLGKIDSDDRDTMIVCLYGGACVAYLLGIFLPFVTVLKQVNIMGISVFSEKNTVSMLGGIWQLLMEGQLLLFLVLFLFSILFPILKLFILYPICCDRGELSRTKKSLKFLSVTGKWSMLDVLVIGILVVTLKLGDMVEVNIRAGMYFFTASVVTSMILCTILEKDLGKT